MKKKPDEDKGKAPTDGTTEVKSDIPAASEFKLSLDQLAIPEKLTTTHLTTKECPIESVTVYNDRAEILRNVTVNLKQGVQLITVTGFPATVEENSVRVSGGLGNATILEVSYRSKFEARKPDNEKVEEQKKEYEHLDREVNKNKKELERIKKQRTLLDGYSLRVVNSVQGEVVSPQSVQGAARFMQIYDEKIHELDKRELELKAIEKDLTNRQSILQKILKSKIL